MSGMVYLIWVIIILSKHLTTVEVSTMGRQSFKQVMLFFIGKEHNDDGGRQACTVVTDHWERDNFKMPVRTSVSSEEHTLKACPGTSSGSSCFCAFVLRILHTSVEVTVSEELHAASFSRISLHRLVLGVLKHIRLIW